MSANLPAVISRAVKEQNVDINNVNIMLPTQTFGAVIGEFDRVSIEVVTIDKNLDAGEVFKVGEKFSLGKVPIDKIGNALGIVWDPKNTGIVESTETKSRAKATGALKKPNGEWIHMTDEKTVDLLAIAEEQRIALEEKAAKGNFAGKVVEWGESKTGKKYPVRFEPWKSEDEKKAVIDFEVRKAMISYRKFKDERAVTGARERCIKALVAIKSSYTAEELSRPFAFPRITLDASKMLADPSTRQTALDRMTGSVSSIFGGSAPVIIPDNAGPTITAEIVEDEEESERDLFGAIIPPQPPESEVDPMQEEFDDLRRWLNDIVHHLNLNNQAGLKAWLATREAENLDSLRKMKTDIETLLAAKVRKGAQT